MNRKWKKAAALGLAVLIGGMMPMSTMLAAEDNTEVVQEIEADSDSGAEVISDENESVDDEMNAEDENVGDEANADDGNAGDEVNAEDGNAGDEANADDGNAGDEMNADDGNAGDEAKTDDGSVGDEAKTDDGSVGDEVDSVNEQNVGIKVMSASDVSEAGDAELQENTNVPVIDIKFNGQNCKVDGLGGHIDYKYTNVANSKFELSASLNGTPLKTIYYFIDKNPGDEAKESISSWFGPNSATDEVLSSDGSYVVYVKAGKDEQTVYARSCGIVVDTTPPEIVGVEEGETYPAGTTFKVEDANLDVVKVNETPTTPEQDGSYRVRANGTSCLIRAIDKAGNEKTCSINVSGGEEPGTGDEEPGTGDEKPGTGDEEPGTGDEKPGTGDEIPETGNIISETGVYTLKAGVKYHLAAGNWKIEGDNSVYQGDNDFYVKRDGDYNFSK